MEFVDRKEEQKASFKDLAQFKNSVCRCIWQAQVRKINLDKKGVDR